MEKITKDREKKSCDGLAGRFIDYSRVSIYLFCLSHCFLPLFPPLRTDQLARVSWTTRKRWTTMERGSEDKPSCCLNNLHNSLLRGVWLFLFLLEDGAKTNNKKPYNKEAIRSPSIYLSFCFISSWFSREGNPVSYSINQKRE